MTCSPVAALAFPTADVDLDTFFDVSLDLLVVRELDGRVVKASASWFTVLGYRPDEIEGQGLLRLIHPDDHAATPAAGLHADPDAALAGSYDFMHLFGHVTLMRSERSAIAARKAVALPSG